MWSLKEHGYKPEHDGYEDDESLVWWLASWLAAPGILLYELLKWLRPKRW